MREPSSLPPSPFADDGSRELEKFLRAAEKQDLLRFITCGSVDDGKSTLLGRLLWDSQSLHEDHRAALIADSHRHGTNGQDPDFALLLDGLDAERAQGITIDVAYRFFATARRRFIVADTPGHEEYTRNMVTGASTAKAAVLLVDARKGLTTQTRRHAALIALLGLKHVILAINKMDLVDFQENKFQEIAHTFEDVSTKSGFETRLAIPVCALRGDNVLKPSSSMPWYQGATLIKALEEIPIDPQANAHLVFPVQLVTRADSSFRGYAGCVAQGKLSVGDSVRITRSGQTATISRLATMDGDLPCAQTGQAVTLVLDREVDVSRGDILSSDHDPLEMTDQFEALLVWMQDQEGFSGRGYEILLATQTAQAVISNLKYKLDVKTGTRIAAKKIALNDLCVVTIALNKALVFDNFSSTPCLGRFILVDRMSQATVAAGFIRHNLRRAQNVHHQSLSITQEDREKLNGHKACVVWLTGLSGAGKSTIADALEKALYAQGKRTIILDGDNLRQGLNKDLGFTDEARIENIRRVIEVAKLMTEAGLIVITAFISPFAHERAMAKERIGAERFIEVFVATPLATCEERDPKGLYKKARAGQIPNMTGINSPYEIPENPALKLEESLPLDACVSKIFEHLP